MILQHRLLCHHLQFAALLSAWSKKIFLLVYTWKLAELGIELLLAADAQTELTTCRLFSVLPGPSVIWTWLVPTRPGLCPAHQQTVAKHSTFPTWPVAACLPFGSARPVVCYRIFWPGPRAVRSILLSALAHTEAVDCFSLWHAFNSFFSH